MTSITQLFLAALPWLLFLFTDKGFCVQSVHCQWGPYGDWSECDSCTNLQTRSRSMTAYAQFGGNPCGGERAETRACVTTQGCPLQQGCGERFRCRSGMCISQSLVCNGDQDCEEDGLDERTCEVSKHIVCGHSNPPPNIDVIAKGFNVVTGQRMGIVINTKSFGGQCRTIFSGVHNKIYRLPLSTIQYNFMVQVQNDFSDEMFESKWHYAKDIVNRETYTGTTTGYKNYDFHETQDQTKTQRLVVLKNNVEVGQFQSTSPKYIPISEEFWKAVARLPSVYDYAAYRKVLERFGTHYLSAGSLGGSFKFIAKIDQETEVRTVSEISSRDITTRTKRWFLIFPITHVTRDKGQSGSSVPSIDRSGRNNPVQKVVATGGGAAQITAVEAMTLSEPERNWEVYSNWAESVRSFPDVTKQTLRPLSELVKEVQCAGAKRLYLRRAIEQYLTESDTCHCRPCSNNGMVVMDGDECKCICKPGTKGPSCEQGTEVEGQPGVIHGSWACWSAWSSCSANRRSRSRSCSNPTPQNGGQHCIGEPTETSDCEDGDLQHLRKMEPQCFDITLTAGQKCGEPPALINGYILDPKDVYLVGNRVEYSCTDGYYLLGSAIECMADKTWSAKPGLCTISMCSLEFLTEDVIATPVQKTYGIGEIVTLSCPAGRQLIGDPTIICDPSLHFSPDPRSIKCSPASKPQTSPPSVECKPWEKSFRGKCVCKMPFECGSSLGVCATTASGRSLPLSVCKMHALQCAGTTYTLAEDSTCKWPQRNTTGCTNCHMWETCDDQTNECRCKDSADCLTPGINVCARVGENATAASQTMSECEAGQRGCKGEKVSVVSILPCAG
ncbi:complement component C7 [Centropristis striata]|uniref:complement component C7 n=1 Tax=Centropristis striata TaxID=184440 RepID=UPI0027DF8659|nr:complement component C7 [Centropristis striata]XP_059193971.1 complement component C7 [Centropristis striata]